jgi:hypothetical protein
MIIMRIFGGLGNQLFQYAAARALADRHGAEVKLDVSRFESYDLRNFDLAKLNVPVSIASPEEISRLKAGGTLQRVKERILPYRFRHFYKEPHFHYDPSFFHLGQNVYLQGYFQSEKYFSPIEKLVRNSFSFDHLVPDDIKKYGEGLVKEDSVSLHIRRGDYKNAQTLNVHGILPIDYYRKAIELTKEKYPHAVYYLFSDEPSTALKELGLQEANVVSGEKTQTHFEDIFLMSRCRHNIIANSSFSWWAAWLNEHPDKTVIAPKQWFNNGPKDTQDLLPQDWIRI